MDVYKPPSNKAVTLEFFVDEDKTLYVVFNKRKYLFSEFWSKVQDSEMICYKIYDEFKNQYPEKFKTSDNNSKDWKETFLRIVNNHFNIYDKILDVFIRSSGEVVFRIEH